MSDYTYELPDPIAFLYTLREYLAAESKSNISQLLEAAKIEYSGSGQYSGRWNAYWISIGFFVPVKLIGKLNKEIKEEIEASCRLILPESSGYDISSCYFSPIIEAPTIQEDNKPLNVGSLIKDGIIEHDGLSFRSRTETKIYDALKKRKVLFFPNSAAVFGFKDIKREPDFLVCQNGKWGVLEVMGDRWHSGQKSVEDHERARLFKDYGLFLVEFYDATKCYQEPEKVVDNFLKLLANS